jgi:hypothetical protein
MFTTVGRAAKLVNVERGGVHHEVRQTRDLREQPALRLDPLLHGATR